MTQKNVLAAALAQRNTIASMTCRLDLQEQKETDSLMNYLGSNSGRNRLVLDQASGEINFTNRLTGLFSNRLSA